jgi:hypothetical protein
VNEPKSVEEVNTAFASACSKEGLQLARVGFGRASFYFENVGRRGAPSEPIAVSNVSDYTIDQWLDELHLARVLEELNPRDDY